MSNIIPDEAMFFIADRQYSIPELVQTLYKSPSPITKSHFLSINSHISDNIVQAGQMVIITPENVDSCQKWELIMQEAALEVDKQLAKMANQERNIMANHYAFINNYTMVTAPMYGWANSYFSQKTKQIEAILKQIERLYQSTYRNKGAIKGDHFFGQRKALFVQLDTAMNGMMNKELFGSNSTSQQLKRKLGLSTKAITYQWKNQAGAGSIKEFSSNYSKLAKVAKNFSRLGYASMALDVGGGAANIHKACSAGSNDKECSRAKVVEPMKVTGSIAGGMLGGSAASYVTCSLIFGLPTGGSSFLWCAVAAGAAGGYAGSKVGKKATGDLGSYIYEASSNEY